MVKNLLEVRDLSVHFSIRGGFGKTRRKIVRAVDSISFEIREGEILALVGESGSGKTTTGKAILQLVDSTGGEVRFDGETLSPKDREQIKSFRRKAQMIYQDPYQSLNPRDEILDIVTEPLVVNKMISSEEERLRLGKESLELAGLIPGEEFFFRYPFELSGGQRQRVAIASAMIMNPKFVVADEPVSMLDASIRTGILRLMVELKEKKGLSYLFITHDLSLAWLISDRIAIMYLGKIMEVGGAEEIIHRGLHPYTKALTRVMPQPGRGKDAPREVLEGETPNPDQVTSGCKFAGRCPEVMEICRLEEPPLRDIVAGHACACHRVGGNGSKPETGAETNER